MSILFDMLKQENFLIVNKLLIQSIGLDEAILFAELVSKHDYYYNQNKLNQDGSFYCTIDDIQMSTGLREKVQAKSIKNLKQLGLIQVVVKGLPARRFFYLNADENLLKKYLEEGKKKIDEYYNKNNNTPSKPVNSTVLTFSETGFYSENNNNNTHTIAPSVSVSPKSETSNDKNQNLSGEKSKQDLLNVEEIISNQENINNNIIFNNVCSQLTQNYVEAAQDIDTQFENSYEKVQVIMSECNCDYETVLNALKTAYRMGKGEIFSYAKAMLKNAKNKPISNNTKLNTVNASKPKSKFLSFPATKYNWDEIESLEMQQFKKKMSEVPEGLSNEEFKKWCLGGL